MSFHMLCEILSSSPASGFAFLLSEIPPPPPTPLSFLLSSLHLFPFSPPSFPSPSFPLPFPPLSLYLFLPSPSSLPVFVPLPSPSPSLPSSQCFWHLADFPKAGGQIANSSSFLPLWFPSCPLYPSLSVNLVFRFSLQSHGYIMAALYTLCFKTGSHIAQVRQNLLHSQG